MPIRRWLVVIVAVVLATALVLVLGQPLLVSNPKPVKLGDFDVQIHGASSVNVAHVETIDNTWRNVTYYMGDAAMDAITQVDLRLVVFNLNGNTDDVWRFEAEVARASIVKDKVILKKTTDNRWWDVTLCFILTATSSSCTTFGMPQGIQMGDRFMTSDFNGGGMFFFRVLLNVDSAAAMLLNPSGSVRIELRIGDVPIIVTLFETS